MADFLTALGLVLVIEGVAWALFPEVMRRLMAQVLLTPPSLLRAVGIMCAALGVFAVWLVRSAMMTP
ncbi:conserved hypothetical protein [Candidatus Terasakiella magnetica]|nr:conserved hypothetical protein [Candidatus Terasakiella magnetica]